MSQPSHIAFIMDGNRRWARSRGLPSLLGHREGVKTFEKISDLCVRKGIRHITFYTFSTENWSREKEEVRGLFSLMKKYSASLLEQAKKNQVKVNFLGDLSKLEPELQEILAKASAETQKNKKASLNLALNYSGRAEIITAATRCLKETGKITKESLRGFLYTEGQPDPDLVVRTGGEKRLSNFLTWQTVYSELYFTDCLWPDFDEEELNKALTEYSKRSRRFGK